MRRRHVFLAACLGLATGANAIESAPYLLSTEGVQAAGLAGAVGAMEGSAEALWYNPGALSDLKGVEASFARLSFPGAYDSDHLLLGAPLNWKHHLGLLYHRNATQDNLRDALGRESGTFEVSQSVLGLGYSYRWHDLSVGAAYKMLNEVIEKQSGSASVFDVGTVLELNKDAVTLGAALQNIGNAPVLGSGGPVVEAPMLARGSAALRLSTDVSTWRLLGDYRYAVVSARGAFSLGLDYSEELEDSRLGFRVGWDFSQGALGGAAGLAVGAGFGYGPVGLDYAFAPKEALGSQHRVALTLFWDLRAKSKAADLDGYLGPKLASVATPVPTPTHEPFKYAPLRKDSAGAALDALLAATPSPTPQVSPTPVVDEKTKRTGGILGALSRFFSFSKAAETDGEDGDKPKGLLRGVFDFLGLKGAQPEASADDEPLPVEAAPTEGPTPGPTPLPMQRLKGDTVR